MNFKNAANTGPCSVEKESPWTQLECSIKELARSRVALTDALDQFCMVPSSGEVSNKDGAAAPRSYHRILNESPGEISAEAGEIMNQVNRLRDLLGIQ